jgi:hypothetical protein
MICPTTEFYVQRPMQMGFDLLQVQPFYQHNQQNQRLLFSLHATTVHNERNSSIIDVSG